MNNLINLLRVSCSVLLHRIWIGSLKDENKYSEPFKYALDSTTPFFRTLPSYEINGRLRAAKNTFTPPGWIPNAPIFIIQKWKKELINRSYNFSKQSQTIPYEKSVFTRKIFHSHLHNIKRAAGFH